MPGRAVASVPSTPLPTMNLQPLDAWLWTLASMAGAAIVATLAYVVARPIVRRVTRHATVASAIVGRLAAPSDLEQ